MNPHATAETLLATHGRDRAGRQAARDELVEVAGERARYAARFFELSAHCEADVKAGTDLRQHRCRNDGSSCLCECHDPEEEKR